MKIGTAISGTAHAGLIFLVLFGDMFRSVPPEPEIQATTVTTISAEEFDVMIASEVAPETDTAAPEAPQPADQLDPLPVPDQVTESTALPQLQPAAEAPSLPDQTPAMAALVPPPPNQPITEAPPAPPQAPQAPVVQAPERPDTPPSPQAAPRVAPLPSPEPLPDATPDEVVQQEAVPEAVAEAVTEETVTTAPEEASTEIVTEADIPSGAPDASPRPMRRPSPPVQTAQPVTPPPAPEAPEAPEAPQTPPASDPVETEVAEAETEAPAPAAPSALPQGDPLTSAEKEKLRVAVRECWNVGALSTDALRTVVTVLVTMTEDARPENVTLMTSTSDNDATTQIAYQAARRAVIRCGARGYDLPAEKYSQWREIEMTFNPEEMRNR